MWLVETVLKSVGGSYERRKGTNLGQDGNRRDVSKCVDDLLCDVRLCGGGRVGESVSFAKNGNGNGRIPFRMQTRPQCRLRKRGRVDHLPRNTCERDGQGLGG